MLLESGMKSEDKEAPFLFHAPSNYYAAFYVGTLCSATVFLIFFEFFFDKTTFSKETPQKWIWNLMGENTCKNNAGSNPSALKALARVIVCFSIPQIQKNLIFGE